MNHALDDQLNKLPEVAKQKITSIEIHEEEITYVKGNNSPLAAVYNSEEQKIHIYQNAATSEEKLRRFITHEVGHAHEDSLPLLIGRENNISQAEWMRIHSEERAPTDYGSTVQYEDFAESYMLYFTNPEKLEASCPMHFDYMSRLLDPTNELYGKWHMPSKPLH